MKKPIPTCTLVTHSQALGMENYDVFLQACLAGGVDTVQLREKQLPYPKLLAFGHTLKMLLDAKKIPLIVNDHVGLCQALDTAGVHLGQSDGDVLDARRRLGRQKIIGLTVDTLEQLEIANRLPIDYVGIGAIFPSRSKSDVLTVWGLDGLRKALAHSRHPIIAIGGITSHNVSNVRQTGVAGIAVIGALHQAACPQSVAQSLSQPYLGV